ncbi:unnamed protein product [Calypogeia fissa]
MPILEQLKEFIRSNRQFLVFLFGSGGVLLPLLINDVSFEVQNVMSPGIKKAYEVNGDQSLHPHPEVTLSPHVNGITKYGNETLGPDLQAPSQSHAIRSEIRSSNCDDVQTFGPDLQARSKSYAIRSSNRVEVRLEGILTTNNKADITDVVKKLNPDSVSKGSKVLRKRFKMTVQDGRVEFDSVLRQEILNSMKPAFIANKDFTLQLGSYPGIALKHTDAGLRTWSLAAEWTPTICDIRCSWSLLNILTGDPAKWIVRGYNLGHPTITLNAATVEKVEPVRVIDRSSSERESRLHGLICDSCEEPPLIRS